MLTKRIRMMWLTVSRVTRMKTQALTATKREKSKRITRNKEVQMMKRVRDKHSLMG
jgi:hypothetical protein